MVVFLLNPETLDLINKDTLYEDVYSTVIISAMLGWGLNRSLASNRQFKLDVSEKFSVIGELATALSHNVKGLLSAPIFDIDRLKSKFSESDDTQTYEALQKIYNRVIKAEGMLRELNHISHVAHEQFEWIKLETIIREAASLVLIAKKNVHFEFETEMELKIFGDKKQLEALFVSLFLNSLKEFEKEKTHSPKISVLIKSHTVIVFDNGPGFSKQKLIDLNNGQFHPSEESTGLGLFLSNRIMKRHHGTIHFSSSKGAKIKMIFPNE